MDAERSEWDKHFQFEGAGGGELHTEEAQLDETNH